METIKERKKRIYALDNLDENDKIVICYDCETCTNLYYKNSQWKIMKNSFHVIVGFDKTAKEIDEIDAFKITGDKDGSRIDAAISEYITSPENQ